MGKRDGVTVSDAGQMFARFFAEVTLEAKRLQLELNADPMRYEKCMAPSEAAHSKSAWHQAKRPLFSFNRQSYIAARRVLLQGVSFTKLND